MTTQEILLATAKAAARVDNINYLYPEVANRPDVAVATANFTLEGRKENRICPNHEFVTSSGFYFSPLFEATIFNVAPAFVAVENGTISFLPEKIIDEAPPEPLMPPVDRAFLPDESWGDEPPVIAAPVSTNNVVWEGDKVYLGLLVKEEETDRSIQNLFLRIGNLPPDVAQQLASVPVSVGRHPVRLQPLRDVAQLANSQQPLGREAMTVYRKKETALARLEENIFCLTELPRDRVGELECYPEFVREELQRTPSLVVLTFHLRPRCINASAFENCLVETNVLPVWNTRRVSLNLKAGDHYQLRHPSDDYFLGVCNARRSDEVRLREACGELFNACYRVYCPEPSGELLKALKRQLLTLDATISSLKASVELLDEAQSGLSVETLETLSRTLHAAEAQIREAESGLGNQQHLLAVAPGPVEHNYYIDYRVCQRIAPGTLERGTNLLPAATTPGGSPVINCFSATLTSPVISNPDHTPDFLARKAFVKDMFSIRKNSADGTA